MTASGLIGGASFENLSGGGGGRAIAHLIETASRQQRTLLVNSTPILLRSLRGSLPQSFRDLTPIAAVIGDSAAFAVAADSPLEQWQEVVEILCTAPESLPVAGGSVRGGMDHVVAALAARASGCPPQALRYVAYDTGGKALAGLLVGESKLLSTGLGEAIEAERGGLVRILVHASPERLPELPQVPTFAELGYDVDFVNWRGFFGPPGLSETTADSYSDLLGRLLGTVEWAEARERYGWSELYLPRTRFRAFLEHQEGELRDLLVDLGMAPGSPPATAGP